ncbi:MAG: hypothetical protein HY761_05025 [Candidatus Omnitrophica bacterium]|nr:hypothetical protein [Candidatus Omnitrophota bacterium]
MIFINVRVKKRCHLLSVAKGYLIAFLLFFVSTGAHALQYKGLDLKISGTTSETYDDNLTFSKADKKEDFITALGLNMSTAYEGKRRFLNLAGGFNYGFNARYKDIKNSSEYLNLNFKNEFSNYDDITLNYNFSHSSTPGSFQEAFGRVSGRYESYANNYGVHYLRNLSEHFSISAMYNYSSSKAELEEVDKWWQSSYGINCNYLYSTDTSVVLSYSHANSSSDVVIESTSIGLRQNISITKAIQLSGNVGMSSTSAENSKSSALNMDIALQYEIDQKTNFSLAYTKNIQTYPNTDDAYRNWQINSSLAHNFLEQLNSTISSFYAEGKSISTDITNRFLGVSFLLQYEISEHLTTSLNYVYSNSNSTNELGGYNRDAVTANVSLNF